MEERGYEVDLTYGKVELNDEGLRLQLINRYVSVHGTDKEDEAQFQRTWAFTPALVSREAALYTSLIVVLMNLR